MYGKNLEVEFFAALGFDVCYLLYIESLACCV